MVNAPYRKVKLPTAALRKFAACGALLLFFSGLHPYSSFAATSGKSAAVADDIASQTAIEKAPATANTKYAKPAPPGKQYDDRYVVAKKNGAKKTLGWLQSIRLLPHKIRLTAKLDTGAKSSVIHAVNIKSFKRKNQRWVRFSVQEEKKKTGLVQMHFELPVVDKSRVKQHHVDELDERYVIELDFCIAGKVYKAEFSLDNRAKFNYPVLLGRDFLQDYFVIDPASTFVAKYNCLPKSKANK